MSGGSWDYVYRTFEDIAERLDAHKSAKRRAFGKHMHLIAQAMKAIEWVDSGDRSSPTDDTAIDAVLGASGRTQELAILVDEAKKLIQTLQTCVKANTIHEGGKDATPLEVG